MFPSSVRRRKIIEQWNSIVKRRFISGQKQASNIVEYHGFKKFPSKLSIYRESPSRITFRCLILSEVECCTVRISGVESDLEMQEQFISKRIGPKVV